MYELAPLPYLYQDLEPYIDTHTMGLHYLKHQKNYLETQEGRNLPVEHCIEGTIGWQIREEIMKAVSDNNFCIIDKPVFGSLKLAEDIKTEYENKQDNLEIVLVGVCTGICVISNAMLLKAALPEAVITVKADACACVTPESHKIALDAMENVPD